VSALVVAGVALLGGAGAVARVLLGSAIDRRTGADFPLGTLAVNLAGAFALGLLVGAGAGGDTLRLVGTGLLGAFTTFSTWVVESHRLGEQRRAHLGVLNVVVSLVLGLGAVWLGRHVGRL
jgi:CrcB protein